MPEHQQKPLNQEQLRSLRLEAILALDAVIGEEIPLKAQGSWPAAQHLLKEDVVNALIAAISARKPLLVRGEPGVGKSQLARVAAAILNRPFLAEVIQPDSEYTDLLWRIDHTQRLADAQILGRPGNGDSAPKRDVCEISHYIGPGALWWAINPKGAQDQHNKGASNYLLDQELKAEQCSESGVVLLIDEIDKADISLTNGLLEVLGNGGFGVPPTGEIVASIGPPPLVVLTSNNSRELPPALLRRCVVLTLSLGDTPEAVMCSIMKIAATVFPDLSEEKVREPAAKLIVNDRKACLDGPKTGLAEYLDLLSALSDLGQAGEDPNVWMKRLGGYFRKSQVNRD